MSFRNVLATFSLLLALAQAARIPSQGSEAAASNGGENHRLKASVERVEELGGPLPMGVQLQDMDKDVIESCEFTSPEGKMYRVYGGKVIVVADGGPPVEAGDVELTNPADGVVTSCDVTVKSMTDDGLGIWEFKIKIKDVAQFQVARLTATTDLRVQDVRLPSDVKPSRYVVHVTPFFSDFTIAGKVEVAVTSEKARSTIILHIKEVAVHEDDVDVEGYTVVGHGYDAARDFYIIHLDKELEAGKEAKVTIGYSGILSDSLAGFYRSDYTDEETGEKKYIAVTQFEVAEARRALPCFDEPAMKAVFQINLGRTKNMTSISNMPIDEEGVETPGDPEFVWDVYQETEKMSTYLLAFVVSDFEWRQGVETDNGVEFRIWSRKSAQDQTEYAADVGPRILQFYEDYFNVDFPLPKQDMIAIPDFSAGAMENWGLITYRETLLLFEPGVSSVADRESVATVVAHELAHQWFGNLVTMEWWTDLWLNEGFATYTEYIGTDHVEPDTGKLDRFVIESLHPAFAADAVISSHPISVDVQHPDEITEVFDTIAYQKGASVIRMMANYLGLSTFNKGITNYLNKHEFGNAKQDDLWESLTEVATEDGSNVAGQTVKEIMDTWTLQMGYPVVTVRRTYDGGNTVAFRQDRFLLDPSQKFDANYLWWIPISYTSAGSTFDVTEPKEWLSPDDTDQEKPIAVDVADDEALIVNVQQTGFYRVNYDKDNWLAISKALDSDPASIHVANRGQVLNDALNLARAGQLDYQTALELTKYIGKERELVPWGAYLRESGYLNSMFERSADYGEYRDYATQSLAPLYEELGFSPQEGDSFSETELRRSAVGWLCDMEYEDCVTQSVELFQQWRSKDDPDEENPIDASLRYTVYCTAVREGSQETWDFLWARLSNANNANERSTLMGSLACSTDVWILKTYLEMSIDPDSGIRKQDSGSVIAAVSGNVVGRDLAWDWIREEWERLAAYLGGHTLGRIVSAATRTFNTPVKLSELEKLYDEHQSELGGAERDVKNAIETVKSNVQWMDANYETIVQWLVDQQQPQ